ncbi:hypothetical protein HZH66_002726 [Vespula vulgaris]|uniref:Uncharacterized protein n=1 Tax=Vespula vulgaris TaxID=7454 RepID=A0A834KHQ3_VESVU|nr:hypothetical protein HZH66_002726 [Vespula vulgaris]
MLPSLHRSHGLPSFFLVPWNPSVGLLGRGATGPASHQSVSRRDDRGGFTVRAIAWQESEWVLLGRLFDRGRRRITGLPREGCSAKPESPGTRTFRTPPTPPPQSFMIPTTIP